MDDLTERLKRVQELVDGDDFSTVEEAIVRLAFADIELSRSGLDRVAIAKIIEPAAFSDDWRMYYFDELQVKADQQRVLAKADAIIALAADRRAQGDGEHPLARMVAIDEELEAEHPGWMTGKETDEHR